MATVNLGVFIHAGRALDGAQRAELIGLRDRILDVMESAVAVY